MRPARLAPLFASLTSLPGIGPKLDKLFARLLGRDEPRVADLLFVGETLHRSARHQPVVQPLVETDIGVLQVDQVQARRRPGQVLPVAETL